METTSAISTKQPVSAVNAVIDIIHARRAVRAYHDRPVERAILELIIESGRMAPSAINRQPWKFYILTDKIRIRAFSREIARVASRSFLESGLKPMLHAFKDFLHFTGKSDFLHATDPVFHGAPVVVFITGTASNEWSPLDIGMCAQNMMLAAKSLGIDSCPVGLAKFITDTKFYPLMNIDEQDKIFLAIVFGYGKEAPVLHERRKDNVFYI